MTLSGLKAVIFDLDDTLYSERAFVFSGFRAAVQRLEALASIPSEVADRTLREMFERGMRGNLFDRLLKGRLHEEKIPGLVEEMIAAYREHYPEISPFHGAVQLLERLKSRYRLGMLSDGWLPVQEKKLVALGVVPYFDAIVLSDQWGRDAWKPNTRPYHEVCRALGVAPEEAVYVADNPAKDFLGARRSGMRSVRLRSVEGLYAFEEPANSEASPDADVPTFVDLERLLTADTAL